LPRLPVTILQLEFYNLIEFKEGLPVIKFWVCKKCGTPLDIVINLGKVEEGGQAPPSLFKHFKRRRIKVELICPNCGRRVELEARHEFILV